MSNVRGQMSKVNRRRVYMDYASTTPLDSHVRKAMEPFFSETFGNPSSIHREGTEAKKALDEARMKVARTLQAHVDEIVFTGGGTESNNLAVNLFRFNLNQFRLNLNKRHVVTTNIEHSSVLEPFQELERQGRIEVSYVPVEPNGIVKAEKIIAAIRPNTALVSVMYANNEIGTIQPIREISKLLRNFSEVKSQKSKVKSFARPIFHTDASQAPLYLDCTVARLGVDLMTLDGHKMYGPKGAGLLYCKRAVPLQPILYGGGQERGLRSTTENIPGIVGFARALEIAVAKREKESARLSKLRDFCHSNILQNVGMTKMVTNGDVKERLPNNLNISFPGVDTEMLTLQLDAKGIACSTKSSCLSSEGGSYVVRALGGGEARATSTLRFTFGRETTKKDIDYLIAELTHIIK